MSSTFVLVMILWAFWGTWTILAIIFKRSWIHVVAIYPWLMLGLGLLLNMLYDWAGTITVGTIQLVLVVDRVWFVFRTSKSKKSQGHEH